MNDNMRKVLVALRDGGYWQTQGNLQDYTGHCCLGVMCEVFEKETGETIPRNNYGEIIGGNLHGHKSVQEWVGLSSPCGLFTGKHKDAVSLAGLNDNGSTFTEIADFIESEPQGLLV
jgi:hypothetical protein